jgi:hypothetical protein
MPAGRASTLWRFASAGLYRQRTARCYPDTRRISGRVDVKMRWRTKAEWMADHAAIFDASPFKHDKKRRDSDWRFGFRNAPTASSAGRDSDFIGGMINDLALLGGDFFEQRLIQRAASLRRDCTRSWSFVEIRNSFGMIGQTNQGNPTHGHHPTYYNCKR